MDLVVVGEEMDAGRALAHHLLERDRRPLLVLDYRGAAARILDSGQVQRLMDEQAVWVDVADIRRPVRLIEVANTAASHYRVARLMARWSRLVRVPMLKGDEVALQSFLRHLLGDEHRPGALVPGARHLGMLESTLANDELCRWAWPPGDAGAGDRARRRVLEVLRQALAYPHVAAAATAMTALPGPDEVHGRSLWVELDMPRLEQVEARLLAMMMHGLMEDATQRLDTAPGDDGHRLPVLLHPPATKPMASLLPEVRDDGAAVAYALRLAPNGRVPRALLELMRRPRVLHVDVLPGRRALHRRSWKSWRARTAGPASCVPRRRAPSRPLRSFAPGSP
ncbi:MAG: hypothetical protein ACQEXJ_25055 [Myxococcota bacterium]